MQSRRITCFLYFMLGVLTIAFSGCGGNDDPSLSQEPTDRVYLISAESGNLSQELAQASATEAQQNQAFTLVMEGIPEEINWFSDRPNRESGHENMVRLIDSWNDYYGGTQPNGVLTYLSPTNQDVEGVYLMLDKPHYDKARKTLRFPGHFLASTAQISLNDLTFKTSALSILNNVSENELAADLLQHAQRASLTIADDNHHYVLSLEGILPKTFFVENAPGRDSSVEKLNLFFVDQWAKRFSDILPNASVYGTAPNGKTDIYNLTLSDPILDLQNNTMRYTASLLNQHGDFPVLLESAILLIDSTQGVDENPDICNATVGRPMIITNNCTTTKSVTVSTGTSQLEPQCLQNLCPGCPPTTVTLAQGTNFSFWTGEYGSSTLAEVVIGTSDAYDISFNKGFDIGMTLIAPTGMVVPKIVAKTSKAYSAYPLPTTLPDCWAAPCTQPNYFGPVSADGKYQLFLCNQPDETDSTPGTYGCALNQCPPNGDMNQCPDWTTLPCQGTPKLTGQGSCYQSCPGT